MKPNDLAESDISRIIEMAWEDRTPFEAILEQYKLSEPQVIRLMRTQMKASSFRMWRKRVSGRKTKHITQRGFTVGRHVCPTQRLR
ncbi:MAG: TIGR03643 family protein [Cocleimonas sp.]